MRNLVVLFFVAILLSGCTSMKAVVAMTRSTDHFMELEDNPAIKYESGAEELALSISPYLDEAIQIIETEQYGSFPKKVSIFVPESIDSFSSYCVSKSPSACVIGNRLFMSQKLLNNRERIPKILIHELSHLQLSQYMGKWDYQLNIPSWFAEGLAVYVSGGGGAEKVERNEAIEAIKSGKMLLPNGSGNLLFRKTASTFGLKPHMFYRQSSLYVEWLHDLNQEHFKQLIILLHKGNTVENAMLASYHFSIMDGWGKFVNEFSINTISLSNGCLYFQPDHFDVSLSL